MNKIEAASPNAKRKVIVAQHVLGLPDRHAESAPLVQPDDDARGRAASIAKTWRRWTRVTPRTSSEPRDLRRVARSRGSGHRRVQGAVPGHPGGGDRARRRLSLEGDGQRNPDPLRVPGRHHERRRPAPEDISLEEGFFTKHEVKVFCYNQQVVDSLTSTINRRPSRPRSRSSGSTRRCPRRATTTRPGCWPR